MSRISVYMIHVLWNKTPWACCLLAFVCFNQMFLCKSKESRLLSCCCCFCSCARESARLHSSLYCTMSRYNLFMRSWGWRCSVWKKERQFFLFLACFLYFFLSVVLSLSLFLSLTPSSPSPADWLPLECETRLMELRELDRTNKAGLGWVTIVLHSMMNEIYVGFSNEGHFKDDLAWESDFFRFWVL